LPSCPEALAPNALPQFSLFGEQEARISLDKAFQVLDEEEEDDKRVRAQQMGRWNRYVV
jgi:hypothetical protein